MMNFKSLFWKLFLGIWLANLLVIVITTAVIVYQWEQKQSTHSRQEMVQQLGDLLIPLLEKQNGTSKARPLPDILHQRSRGLRIESSDGRVLLNNTHFDLSPTYPPDIYQDDEGNRYRIFLPEQRRPPRPFRGPMSDFFRLQFLVIFLVSGLASYLLSLLITRPLKQLQDETRRIGQEGTKPQLDNHLLQRNDEIGDLAREYEQMLLQLNALIDSKQALLHDVSHELRAPLARLMAALGLLQQQHIGNDAEGLERIEKECDEINRLIDSIMSLSRLQSAQAQCRQVEQEQLLANLQQLLEDVRFEFPNHHLVLEPIESGLTIYADWNLLSTAISNILRNACQHTPPGSVVKIVAEGLAHNTRIRITDNGPGVHSAELDKLFKPFYRSKHHAGQGFGLGLNIAQRAVEKCGGTIEAHNAEIGGPESGGLEVTLTLIRKTG